MLHAAKRSSGCYWTVDVQSSILVVGFLVVVCVCVCVCVCDEKGWRSVVMDVEHISVSGVLCSRGWWC